MSELKYEIIKYMILAIAIVSFISCFIYSISNNELWFSRMFFFIICIGFYGVIDLLQKLIMNKN